MSLQLPIIYSLKHFLSALGKSELQITKVPWRLKSRKGLLLNCREIEPTVSYKKLPVMAFFQVMINSRHSPVLRKVSLGTTKSDKKL